MEELIEVYRQRLDLAGATFSHIEHEDAMVALVYRVSLQSKKSLILKICSRPDDYFREVYFLKRLTGTLPVPRIEEVVEPQDGIDGALLMECIPGSLVQSVDFTDSLAYEMGSLLARIHLNRETGYGDLVHPQQLSQDPKAHFSSKFEEGLDECRGHLPQELMDRCVHIFKEQVHLLDSVDGPCIIHRDYRAGNLLVLNGRIQGIIDWSSGRAGFAEEDFCSLEHSEWLNAPSKRESLLAGYASIRLVPDYSKMLPLLRLSKAIATIGFTVKRGTWNNTNTGIYQVNRRFIDLLNSNGPSGVPFPGK